MKNTIDNNLKPKRKSHVVLVGFIIMLIGLICFVTVLGINNWNIYALTFQSDMVEANYVSDSTPTNLVLNVSNAKIEVVGGDTDKINVKYYTNDKENYTFTVNDDGMTIKKIESYKWFEYSILFMQKLLNVKPMVITVPKDYPGNIKIVVDNGSVSTKNFSANKIEVITDNGMIDLENINAACDIKLISENGKINMNNVFAVELVSMVLENGKADINKLKSKSMDIKNENGYVYLNSIIVDSLVVLVENGSVKLFEADILKSGNIIVENGYIKGTIVGSITDFNITSDVDYGKNNLPSATTGADKTLNIETSSGYIEVNFTK